MGELIRHQVHDGAFGILYALFGVGVHHVSILNDKGHTIGEGKGSSEGAAREQAWKNVQRQD